MLLTIGSYKPGVRNELQAMVDDYKQASAIYSTFRDVHDHTMNTIPNGIIHKLGKPVARISYNGKVWTLDDRLLYDPYERKTLDELLTEDEQKRVVGAEYAELVGYDPFKDDPSISVSDVKSNIVELRRYHNRKPV